MLWFGWFGFNAGSALGSNALACHAFMTTNTAAATAMITWMFMDISKGRRCCLACLCYYKSNPWMYLDRVLLALVSEQSWG